MPNAVNLFILGVQKCGTTTLADILSQSDEVFVPSVKETYFFLSPDKLHLGSEWYEREYFSPNSARTASFRIDATPFYLAVPEALERIANYAPKDAKYIVILRDPVERAISAYKHQLRLGYETLSFADALAAEGMRISEAKRNGRRWWRHAYKEVGYYGAHLTRAFSILGRENILVLRNDELQDQDKLRTSLAEFIGLEKPLPSFGDFHSNPAAMPRSRLLLKLITRDNPVKSLAKRFVPREIRSKVGTSINRINSGKAPAVVIEQQTRQILSSAYVQDQALLTALGLHSH